jgi:hypothetical protein
MRPTRLRRRLVYPLRRATYEALAERGRDRSVAQLMHGARRVELELRGVGFGMEGGKLPGAPSTI